MMFHGGGELRTKNRELRTKNQEPRTENQEPRTENREPRTENQEPRTRNRELRTRNQEPRTENQEPGLLQVQQILGYVDPCLMLTPVQGSRVARDARVQQSVDRNVFRSSRGARDSGNVQPRPLGSIFARTAIIRYSLLPLG